MAERAPEEISGSRDRRDKQGRDGDFGVSKPSYLRPTVYSTTDPLEVAMSRIVTSVDELDVEIAVAYIALGSVRGRFERCPSAENQLRIDEAAAEVDRLLDQRLVLQQLAAA